MFGPTETHQVSSFLWFLSPGWDASQGYTWANRVTVSEQNGSCPRTQHNDPGQESSLNALIQSSANQMATVAEPSKN